MMRCKQGLTLIAVLALLMGMGSLHHADAATKKGRAAAKKPSSAGKISSDPDSATVKEAALLKWGPVKVPQTGKEYDFFMRGVVLDISPIKDQKEFFTIKILPIEILENKERFITMDNYKSGVDITHRLAKQEMKDLKKGNIIEMKSWYETIDQGGTGHAKMVAYVYHADMLPYPKSAAPYVKLTDIEPEEQLNALTALELYSGNPKEDGLKDALDALSSSPNPDVKAKAAQLLSSLYSAQPSGTCKVDKVTKAYSCK
jgi:hypothetical protein